MNRPRPSRSLPPVPPLPAPPPRESVEMLDAELARMHVTVSRRFLEKLEAAMDALGHACVPCGTPRTSGPWSHAAVSGGPTGSSA
jgi:hypothetical protein